jgi:hypothetical protein
LEYSDVLHRPGLHPSYSPQQMLDILAQAPKIEPEPYDSLERATNGYEGRKG